MTIFGVYGIKKASHDRRLWAGDNEKRTIDEKNATYKLCASSQIYIFASRRYCKWDAR